MKDSASECKPRKIFHGNDFPAMLYLYEEYNAHNSLTQIANNLIILQSFGNVSRKKCMFHIILLKTTYISSLRKKSRAVSCFW